LNMIDNW